MKHNRWNTGTIRRVIKQASICLLLGAIVNIAICWTIAIRPIDRDFFGLSADGYSDIGMGGIWDIYHGKSFGRIRIRSTWVVKWAGSHIVSGDPPPADDLVPGWATKINNFRPSEINDADITAEATGWPFLAMFAHFGRGAYPKDASGNYYSPILAPHGWVISDPNDRYVRIIPYQPIMSGFAINTIFYGVILWMLFFAPFVWRRWRRIKRGLCTKCGYDLRASVSDCCPECGEETCKEVNH